MMEAQLNETRRSRNFKQNNSDSRMDDATDSKKDNQADITSQDPEDSNIKQDEQTPSQHDSQAGPKEAQPTETKYKKLKRRFDALKQVSRLY